MPRGGGLEAAAAAKPPRGAGVRAHVCAGDREPGRATDARALPSGPRDGHAANLLPRDSGGGGGMLCL